MCCWRENVSHLLYYCHTLPASYIADQRKILFWKKALNCNNLIVRTLANLNRCTVGLILAKYCIPSINTGVNDIKRCMWEHFADECYRCGHVVRHQD